MKNNIEPIIPTQQHPLKEVKHMQKVRKGLSALLIGGLAVAGGYFGNEVFQNQQFAHAQQQVDNARVNVQKANDLAEAFRQVGQIVSPSVVNINVRKSVKAPHANKGFDQDQLRKFFKDMPGFREAPGRSAPNAAPEEGDDDDAGAVPFDGNGNFEEIGTGSGVIMEAEGGHAYILTNNHVAGGADEMVVTLADGTEIKNAKLLGADPKTDLAVVRIDTDKVIAAKWGNSDELAKGDWVMAFGSPFGYVGSMTHGIVSALHRQAGLLGMQGYENFIQVDAPINPGNSGGPLTDIMGNVVGINTAIASRSGGFQGIGFAIPSNQAKNIYNALKDKGKVTRGWLGIGIADVVKERAKADYLGFKGDSGIVVDETFPNTPATGKLQVGDIITSINGKAVKDVNELRNTVATTPPGTEITLGVFRDRKQQDVALKLGTQPEDVLAMATPKTTKGKADPAQKAAESLGVTVNDLNADLAQQFSLPEGDKGAIITKVDRNSAAAKAGLRPGDLVTKVGDKSVSSADEFVTAVKAQDSKKGMGLTVVSREGTRLAFVPPQSDKPEKPDSGSK